MVYYQKQIQERDVKVTQLEAKASQLEICQTELKKVQEERDRLKIRLQSKEIEYQELKETFSKSNKESELDFSNTYDFIT